MNWEKRGHLYNVSQRYEWAYSHCHKPTPLLVENGTLRVYFGVRDRKNITRTTFVDLDISDLLNIRVNYIHDRPVLDVGKIGAFDDSGANVCSLVRNRGGSIYMYFIGWNPSSTVHTRNSIGLAVSNDNGWTFERLYDGPILDRNKEEPYYTGAVDVLLHEGKYRMWYTSGSQWKIINGKPEICYHIKHAESIDGIDWIRENINCIKPDDFHEVTARPSVIYDVDRYRMWYSKRRIDNFRVDPAKGYRGGYAESFDGIVWRRDDPMFGLELGAENQWDSLEIAYPYVRRFGLRYLMLYNGNGFGKTGFGYAVSGIEK